MMIDSRGYTLEKQGLTLFKRFERLKRFKPSFWSFIETANNLTKISFCFLYN